MSKLLRNRWLHRALFVGVLIALGVGIYRATPPEAMWAIDGSEIEPRCFADGGRLLVISGRQEMTELGWRPRRPIFGPISTLDIATGTERSSQKSSGLGGCPGAFSRDGRWFAAVRYTRNDRCIGELFESHGTIALFNAITQEKRQIPVHDTHPMMNHLGFSPAGDLLFHQVNGPTYYRLSVFETESGKLVDEQTTRGVVGVLPNALLLETRPHLEVWSWRERRMIGQIANAGWRHAHTPDGRFVVAEKSADGSRTGKWGIWDVPSCRLEAEFDTGDDEILLDPVFGNGTFLAMARRSKAGNFFDLRELPSGKQLAMLPAHLPLAMEFSPDGRFLLVEGLDPDATETMLEVPSLKVLWRQDRFILRGAWGGRRVLDSGFSSDSRTLFTDTRDGEELQCLDTMTGLARAKIPLLADPSRSLTRLYSTPSRRTLMVHHTLDLGLQPHRPFWRRWLDWLPESLRFSETTRDRVILLDANRCLVRFSLRARGVSSVHLSDDGNTLVTAHDEPDNRRVLRCWDVNAWKPLRWALGVPAGLGAVGVLLAWRRRRRAMVKNAGGGNVKVQTNKAP